MDLSDNDDSSTKLEGKKLKNRGASIKNLLTEFFNPNGDLLRIYEDMPDLDGEGIGTGSEFFLHHELLIEDKEEQEEKRKMEIIAAHLRLQELQQAQRQEQSRKVSAVMPDLKYAQIRSGIMLSQNSGRPVEGNLSHSAHHEVEQKAGREQEIVAQREVSQGEQRDIQRVENRETQRSDGREVLPRQQPQQQENYEYRGQRNSNLRNSVLPLTGVLQPETSRNRSEQSPEALGLTLESLLRNSVPATRVEDVRGKDKELVR